MSANKLTRGQIACLIGATVPMIAAGGLGGWGTYTNIAAEFGRAATAIGVVAAGEGVTLVLAMVMVGLTLLGQSSPAPVRAGLWLAPIAAAATGVVVGDDLTEQVVYAITPLAMSASAEGLGLLARRVVVYLTGVDMEAQRRNAETMQRLAYHRARAAKHPDEKERASSDLESWKLAKKVGVGDAQLGVHLVDVQRGRLGEGADAALADMLTVAPVVTVPVTTAPSKHTATEVLRRRFAEMDPADAIRIAHDAHPDTPPAELAALLITYGVIVDAVQVALVLHGHTAQVTVERGDTNDAPADTPPDTPDAPQINTLPPVTKAEAILQAAAVLGPDFKAADVADRVLRINRITVKPDYVRAVLSRESKKPKPAAGRDDMEGGYA
ncbi:hypothetical protein ACFTTN_21805 [Streptomyces niveus]|uniref:hypothetical protein n=1 Tax=Streptomyces niveus TaxID=193462 RepID=UPI00363BD1C1